MTESQREESQAIPVFETRAARSASPVSSGRCTDSPQAILKRAKELVDSSKFVIIIFTFSLYMHSLLYYLYLTQNDEQRHDQCSDITSQFCCKR